MQLLISIVKKPQMFPNVLTQVKSHTLHGRDIATTEKLSLGIVYKHIHDAGENSLLREIEVLGYSI